MCRRERDHGRGSTLRGGACAGRATVETASIHCTCEVLYAHAPAECDMPRHLRSAICLCTCEVQCDSAFGLAHLRVQQNFGPHLRVQRQIFSGSTCECGVSLRQPRRLRRPVRADRLPLHGTSALTRRRLLPFLVDLWARRPSLWACLHASLRRSSAFRPLTPWWRAAYGVARGRIT